MPYYLNMFRKPFTSKRQNMKGKKMNDNQIIEKALQIIESRLAVPGQLIDSPETVVNYLKIKLATQEREVFAVIMLDNRHRVMDYQELFYGSISSAQVNPREVVKAALYANAAAVIIAHNHPSGVAEPSQADIQITEMLSSALDLIETRLLDHIVIGGMNHCSLNERGLI